MKKVVLAAFLLVLPLMCFAEQKGSEYFKDGKHHYKPADGFVPDQATVVKIAEAVLTPIYGEKTIEEEKPFKAELKDGVWAIRGTLHCSQGQRCLGGVAEIEISKDTGEILRVSHGK